jgi:osmoprotectant transport system permease protein
VRAKIVALLFVIVAAVSVTTRRAAADHAPPSSGHIVIASKNFTESRILGEMLTLLVRSRTRLTVEHRSGLGATLVCFGALKAGQVDVYPDYTGTAWSIVLKKKEKITDRLQAFLEVQKEYRERYDVEWLEPFGLNNTYALAMRKDRAEALGVRTISDLKKHGKDLKAGFSIEFSSREDGWPGLAPYYGLELADVRTLEHGLAYEAISKGSIDLVDAYSTDGKLLRYPLRVLADDRHFFPPYNAAPIVRGATLRAHPELRAALDALAFRISDKAMTHLNYEVEEQGKGFREVARDFLVQQNLLDPRVDVGSDALAGRRSFASFLGKRWKETLRLGLQHVELTLAAVLLAILFAVPLGIVISRSRAAERAALGGAGVVQTIPSLALLAFMIAIPGLGLSVRSAVAALFLYAILPILRNTHTGLSAVDPELVDAATGLGLTPRQILVRIRVPLATRTIMAGVRTATIISIGVATLAAFIGAGGLGEPIVTGLYLNDTWLILSGAIPAALLALLADWLLGRVELWLTPRGIR